jgi:hypothetical protein
MKTERPTISVCTRCRPQDWSEIATSERPGALLAGALRQALAGADLPLSINLRLSHYMN